MRAHALKVILAGRTLEILYACAREPGRQTVTAGEIAAKLNEELRAGKFSPRVASYLKQSGGIDTRQIAWLMRVMSKGVYMPFGLISLPLVTHHSKNHRFRTWSLSPTVARNTRPRRL